jgi:hypothetical protein
MNGIARQHQASTPPAGTEFNYHHSQRQQHAQPKRTPLFGSMSDIQVKVKAAFRVVTMIGMTMVAGRSYRRV